MTKFVFQFYNAYKIRAVNTNKTFFLTNQCVERKRNS